jgi:hypothetical protein
MKGRLCYQAEKSGQSPATRPNSRNSAPIWVFSSLVEPIEPVELEAVPSFGDGVVILSSFSYIPNEKLSGKTGSQRLFFRLQRFVNFQ